MRKALKRFSHYFVQNEASKELLDAIGITNVTVSGDTRLDRVSEILEQNNELDFMAAFKQNRLCFVAGSTWPEDEAILIDYINNAPKHLKFVIAPHKIQAGKMMSLAGAFTKKTTLYSKREHINLAEIDVLIVDHIGLLTAFGTGLHNTLEPAVFGIPVIIGPDFSGFKEAEELVALRGILPIKDQWSFGELMRRLLDNLEYQKETGTINANYIVKNRGASVRIVDFIRTLPL